MASPTALAGSSPSSHGPSTCVGIVPRRPKMGASAGQERVRELGIIRKTVPTPTNAVNGSASSTSTAQTFVLNVEPGLWDYDLRRTWLIELVLLLWRRRFRIQGAGDDSRHSTWCCCYSCPGRSSSRTSASSDAANI